MKKPIYRINHIKRFSLVFNFPLLLRAIIPFVFIFFIGNSLKGQTADMLTRAEMQEDLKTLENHLIKIHPGLNFYQSSHDLPSLFEEIGESLPEKMRPIDFLSHIAPIIDSTKCGHTGFNVKTGEKRLGIFQKDIKGLFPFQLKEVEGELMIYRNLSSDTIHFKDNLRLLKINGEEVSSIIEKMAKLHLGSDGNNQTGEENFVTKYFMLAYHMFYGSQKEFLLSVQNGKTQSISEVRIPSNTLKNLRKIRLVRYPLESAAPIQLRRIEGMEKVALLDINTFSNTKFDYWQLGYRRKIRKIFKLIAKEKIEYLIVDLRDNPGGVVQNVINLMKRTYDTPFVLNKEVVLNRQFFKSDIGFWGKVNMLFRRKSKKEDHYKLKGLSNKEYKPKKRFRYKGNMIILINEGSFSAACTYALYAKSNNRAILLGEEAGGSYHIVSAGISHDCKLKNSDLSVRIPVMRFDYNVVDSKQSTTNGVTPHVYKTISIEEYLHGVDGQMEAAAELIRLHYGKVRVKD